MLFPTFGFAVFFLVVFLGYWYIFRRSFERRLFLVSASFLFYSFWDWRFCILLFLSTFFTFYMVRLLGNLKDYFKRKLVFVVFIAVQLLFLAYFKYYNFFADSVNMLLQYNQVQWILPVINVILPVGISFYTFKALSYAFDVYLCKMTAQESLLDVSLYISFFPQVASGPIVHAVDFFPQIDASVTADRELGARFIEFDKAILLILSGLAKKMIFANFLSTLLVDPVFSDLAVTNTLEVFLATIGYSIVIYTDFSGYSDMAIGVALLLGFKTPENFNRPYMSFSVTEFWKRWHITFSSWLREYLYFALGGSRFGKIRTLFALLFTMILGGLWHGSSVTFIIWGFLQGLALSIERALNYGNRRNTIWWKAVLQILATFAFTTLSWLVFRSRSLEDITNWFSSLANFKEPLQYTSPLVLILLILGLGMHAIPSKVRLKTTEIYTVLPLPAKALFIALFFAFLSIVSMSGVAPFIYFQF